MKTMKYMVLYSLLTGLLLSTTGCFVTANGGGKMVNEVNGGEVTLTFGFNLEVIYGFISYVNGDFQMVDHAPKGGNIIMHGEFDNAWEEFGLLCAGGDCRVKGGGYNGVYSFEVHLLDNGQPGSGDWIWIGIDVPGPDLVYSGVLDKGNISINSK